ncbi:MAG TPA: FKBP-type peptidyl-prolyl cis-trans isomerase [Thermoplasmata archaeon]|nr:FKBP-type peptidyl-prolyl cis-trans isomerase [Thermoplasmata archaeon]
MVDAGTKVKIEYELSLDDGTVLEATAGKEPLEVEVGGGQIMARLDRALLDMKVGEEREIIIPPPRPLASSIRISCWRSPWTRSPTGCS